MHKGIVRLFDRTAARLHRDVDRMRTGIVKAKMRYYVLEIEHKARSLADMSVEDRRNLLRECHDLTSRIREATAKQNEWCANNREW